MRVTLGKTDLKDYELHLSDGDAVVRNPMINALINAKLSGVSPQYRCILATPVFTGTSAANERIQWQTDQFSRDEPRPLSQLTGSERQQYEEILHRAFDEFTRVCSTASPRVRSVMEQALTYHSDDNVYCGEGKVVITEWGMHPKEVPHYEHMTLSVDLPDNGFEDLNNLGQPPSGNEEISNESENTEPHQNSEPVQSGSDITPPQNAEETIGGIQSNEENPGAEREDVLNLDSDSNNILNHNTENTENPDNYNTSNISGGSTPPSIGSGINGDNHTPHPLGGGGAGSGFPPYGNAAGNGASANPGNTNPGNTNPGNTNPGNNGGGYAPVGNGTGGVGSGGNGGYGGRGVVYPVSGRRRRPWWKWLLWLLLLLLVLFILFACLRSCNSDPMRSVLPVAPELKEDDISLSEDSVNMEVNNRLILLIAHGGTVPEFVKDFRKKYPDSKKYILSNPDTLIPRVVLTLPKEEKSTFKNNIQSEFPAWDIVVVPDAIYTGSSTKVNDPALMDKRKRWYFDMTDVFDAWDITMGDKDLVVAVIDDGFDLTHPELQGKIVSPYNAVTHDGNVFPSKSGHGTHVAATAVGNADNGKGTAGIAPNCKLMPIQVADKNGNMTNSAILDGVLYAIYNGADVVNMSLAMYFNPMLQFAPINVQKNMRANNFLEEERLWNKVFELAEERNVSFVIAGGNQNLLIGLDPMQRSPNTIKVSAVQPDKYKASFSNYGDYSVVSAPGVEIYNAVPGNSYSFMQGTSMASPIVAGGVALLKSNDPSLSTPEIATILQETGIPSPSDVGPIVNFARALKGEKTPGSKWGDDRSRFDDEVDCGTYQRRYNELLERLNRLKREHPGCITEPDTLTIPKDAKIADFRGTWKSTTPLYNDQDQEVVIYFTFNGTSNASMQYVEPDGTSYTSPLTVSIEDGKIFMSQVENASSPKGSGYYERYNFVLTPDKNRKASGRGQHHSKASNIINFQLIRLNS